MMKRRSLASFAARVGGEGKRYFDSAVAIYGTFDHRSLGIARIGLGTLLLHNLVRRVPDLVAFYSNDGILPNHTVLWRPIVEYTASFFLAASRPGEAAVMFVACAIVFALFTVGYRTRLFHVLSFACLVSLQTREAFTMNGGDVALDVLAAWTMFLPMGVRFSVDAVRRSLAGRRETTAIELNQREAFPLPQTAPKASLAFFAVLLELSVIYYFNAVNKHGWTWRRGLAVHFVLYQERMVTWFGQLVRDHVTVGLSRVLSYGTLGLEYAAPFLLLSPVAWKATRRAASILLPLMHLGFASCLNVGQFSFNMIGFFPALLSGDDWTWLGRRLGPSPKRARIVHLRADSPWQFAAARLLSRLDLFVRLSFSPADAWEVEDPATGRRTTGSRALAECLAALPVGLPLARFVRLPGVRHVGDGLLALIDRPWKIVRWLRAAAIGAIEGHPTRAPSPARLWVRRFLGVGREAAAVVLLFACANQLLVQNWAIPKRFKPHQPKWVTELIWYTRLDQGWQMFSPDVPTSERHLYVDAVTFDGRRVDPFNEAASRVFSLPLERVPPHLMQNEFWYDYEREIFGNEAYWRALKEWIFNYHLRTGRTQDRIVAFEAKIIEYDFPPPRETEPTNIRTKTMLSAHE
jgi:hypothetical protein